MHQLLVQELTLWEHPEKALSEKVFLCSLSFIHQNFTRTVIKPLHILCYAGDRVEYIGDGSLKLTPRYYC